MRLSIYLDDHNDATAELATDDGGFIDAITLDSEPWTRGVWSVEGPDDLPDELSDELKAKLRDDLDWPEPEPNYPNLYVDGTVVDADIDSTFDHVTVEFMNASNGTQTNEQERGPLGWCNSAGIHLDRDDNEVTATISVGDPRGAFAFTVRRLNDGSLVMHVPYPGEPLSHRPLTEIRPGTYRIS